MRSNQRNSRSKGQAYLKDLELKWSECVRLGAQANAGMQLAARRVALENGFLRDLLRERGLDAEALRSWTQQFWQNRSERPTLDVEASVLTASCLARTGLLTEVCELASARWTARVSSFDDAPCIQKAK